MTMPKLSPLSPEVSSPKIESYGQSKPVKFLTANERAHLLEIAMTALAKGISSPTRPIFEAIHKEQPNAAGPVVGLALILIMETKPDEALEFLQNQKNTKFARQDLIDGITYLAYKISGQQDQADKFASRITFSDSAEQMITIFNDKCSHLVDLFKAKSELKGAKK